MLCKFFPYGLLFRLVDDSACSESGASSLVFSLPAGLFPWNACQGDERKPCGVEVLVLGPRTGGEPRLSAYAEKATEEQQNGATRSVAPQWPTVPLPYWHCLLLLLAT